MEPGALVAAVRREGEALAAAAEGNLDRPVPSCPGWDVGRVVDHIGRIHRWVAGLVTARAMARPPFPPRQEGMGAAWVRQGVAAVASALDEVGPDTPLWTFRVGPQGVVDAPSPGTARFWFRRQAVETVVHRWDVEAAVAGVGGAGPIEPELGVTGVDELLDVLVADRPVSVTGTLHLLATDSGHGDWTVRAAPGGDGLMVGHGHDEGDAGVRGAAGDLLLWLWGRELPAGRLETSGDAGVLAAWSAALTPG